jgi:hypothetical protein
MSIDDIREILCLVSEPNRAGDAANARIASTFFDLDVHVAHLMELKTSLLDLRRSLMQPSLQEHTATSLVTGGRFSKRSMNVPRTKAELLRSLMTLHRKFSVDVATVSRDEYQKIVCLSDSPHSIDISVLAIHTDLVAWNVASLKGGGPYCK